MFHASAGRESILIKEGGTMRNALAFNILIVSLLIGIFISVYFDLPYRLIGIITIIIVLAAMVYIASMRKEVESMQYK